MRSKWRPSHGWAAFVPARAISTRDWRSVLLPRSARRARATGERRQDRKAGAVAECPQCEGSGVTSAPRPALYLAADQDTPANRRASSVASDAVGRLFIHGPRWYAAADTTTCRGVPF